jgi:two-component system sensor histidine kinase GlrK
MGYTIFSRLNIGFLLIFLLQAGFGMFVALQLNRLQYIRDSILTVDTQIIDYEKKVTDGLLSQMRYEKKFLITRDAAVYDLFLENNQEVNHNIIELTAVARSNNALPNLVSEIEKLHNSYNELCDREIAYLKAGIYYPRGQYQEDKEKTVYSLLKRLKKLRSDSKQHINDRI